MSSKLNRKKITGENIISQTTSEFPITASEHEVEIKLLYDSELFDIKWYRQSNSDLVGLTDEELLVHYYYHGGKEGRSPNYLFNSKEYLDNNSDVLKSGMNPLVHYIRFGENERRVTSILFDLNFYIKEYSNKENFSTYLAHFLKKGVFQGKKPNAHFNTDYYLKINKDIKNANKDSYKHFLFQGFKESRNPSEKFNLKLYKAKYLANDKELNINPFIHYLQTGEVNNDYTILEADSVFKDISKFTSKSDKFEEFEENLNINEQKKIAKVIAFYLPQFHAFKENDEWWGKGFTEWNNISRGVPRFKGHYQPRIPRDLGFYDLSNNEVIKQQINLAKKSGIHGFCFYYYWFNKKRLLDSPINAFIEDKTIDFPFCIMWANENWTRTWDGFEKNILIEQKYDENDDELLIEDWVKYLSHPNYIKINGKLLFIIYRPGIIPDATNRISKWKKMLTEKLKKEILIYMVQGFNDYDPNKFQLDGALEFPPHKIATNLPLINSELKIYDENFSGTYINYDALIEASIAVKKENFDLIKTIVPSWDNEARKPSKGYGFVGSNPSKYEKWLNSAIAFSKKNPIHGESFVFINAWNEWAEGAYLEPDIHFGAAYLNATRRAISGYSLAPKRFSVIYVGHDAHKHGAQLLSLNIIKTLKQSFGVDTHIILLEGGALVEQYKEVCNTYVVDNCLDKFYKIINQIVSESGEVYGICNTVVTGPFSEALSYQGIKVIHLIHELKRTISERNLELVAKKISKSADKIIFAANCVKESFEEIVGDISNKAIIRPQGVYQDLKPSSLAHIQIRNELGLSEDSKVIINLGYGDLRKGFDLFMGIAKIFAKKKYNYHFVWIGNVDSNLERWLGVELEEESLKSHFTILPFTNEVSMWLEGSDCMALTSREDPYPSVVMESIMLGTPVVGFKNGGGYEEILENPTLGALATMGDILQMSELIEQQIIKDTEYSRKERALWASEKYNWKQYVWELLSLLHPDLKKVSVVIPNYNYEFYIHDRMMSVFNQDYPVYEIIVLDDKSTDNSIEEITKCAIIAKREINLVLNESNSKSVFKQWNKGINLCKGDIVWIAEADDSAKKSFLYNLVSKFTDNLTFAYSDSQQINEHGQLIGESYKKYYATVDKQLFEKNFQMEGKQFIINYLSVKNLILNVSSVVFNKKILKDILSKVETELYDFRIAGDWYMYIKLLETSDSNVYYSSIPDNYHRRHESSVTHSNLNSKQLSEIETIHSLIRNISKLPKNVLEQQKNYILELNQMFN